MTDSTKEPHIGGHIDSILASTMEASDGTGIRDDSIDRAERLLRQASETHITEDDLMLFINNEADDVLRARIDGHKRRCRACEATYFRLLMYSRCRRDSAPNISNPPSVT